MINDNIIEHETYLKISEYNDYIPNNETIYFTSLENNSNYPVLIIGITFYNENAFDLRRILVSLADQISSFNNIYCQIVLVGDGYKQMAFDTKEYLRQIFCSSENEFDSWNELMSSLDKQCNENSDIIDKTYILQKLYSNITIIGTKDHKNRYLPLSLILKTKNRRKHNSQQWILSAFAPQVIIRSTENKYVLLSDCGTLFDHNCLNQLINYMENNHLCVGCTGRQRLMTKDEQDCKNEKYMFYLLYLNFHYIVYLKNSLIHSNYRIRFPMNKIFDEDIL